MVIIPLLVLILFQYVPMWGILFAFQDYSLFDGFAGSEWVGLKHFRMLFNAPEFPVVMRNTLGISVLKFLFGFPAPIILALMLNEVRRSGYKRTIQTITYLPHFISWVVVSGFLFNLLETDGLFNDVLAAVGIVEQPVSFLLQPQFFWAILVVSNIWKGVGYGAIIYLAAISNVDPNLYEAAEIDGAQRFQKIWYVTLPSILGVVFILMVLSIGNILNAGFEDIFLLTNNMRNYMLTDVANTIDIYVYREGVLGRRYSYATAAGLFKSILNATLLTLANTIVRRLGREGLW
jgi:putative aldouronate transport system permease protein